MESLLLKNSLLLNGRNPLAYDCQRCLNGASCKVKEDCMRWLSRGFDGPWTPYGPGQPELGDKCSNYWRK